MAQPRSIESIAAGFFPQPTAPAVPEEADEGMDRIVAGFSPTEAPDAHLPQNEFDPGILPTVLRVATPIAGSVLGSLLLTPGGGTALGGALGGAMGEIAAEELEVYAGLRSGKNFKRISLETLLGSMPMIGRLPGVQSVLARVAIRAGQAAGVSAGAITATQLVETGDLPEANELLTAAGLGGLLGGFGGVIEARHLKRIAPKLAKELAEVKKPRPVEPDVIAPDDDAIIQLWTAPNDQVVFGKFLEGPTPQDRTIQTRFPKTLDQSELISPTVKANLDDVRTTEQVRNTDQVRRGLNRVNANYAKEIVAFLDPNFHMRTGDDTALGEVLILRAQFRGDHDAAVQVAKKMTTELTDAGRVTQAASIMRRLSPEGILVWMQKLYTKAGMGDLPYSKVQPFMDEAKRIQGMPAGRDRDVATHLMIRDIQEIVPASKMDKVLEFWKAGLLSGLPTQIVNSVGNAFNILWRSGFERTVEAGIEAVRTVGGLRGERKVFFREGFDAALGVWQGAKEGGRRFLDAWSYETAVTTGRLDVHRRSIPGEFGRFARIPFRLLTAMDEFFKSVVFQGEIHRQAYRAARQEVKAGALSAHDFRSRIADLVSSPTPEMLEKAEYEKFYQVFQKPLGAAGKSGAKLLKDNPVLQLIFPFYTTPVNIAKFGLERTPLGTLRTYGRILSGHVAGEEISEELAKGVAGAFLAAGIAAWVHEGAITGGGPSDPEARKALRATGWQPYSIRVGGTYQSFARLEPLSTVLGMLADFVEIGDYIEKESAIQQISFAVSNNITNKTFIQGLARAIGAIGDPERRGARFIQGLAGSAVPTIVKNIAQAVDPTLRRPSAGSLVLQPIEARIPGATFLVPPLRGLWGAPVVIQTPGVERAISPFYRTEIKSDFATDEVVRVGKSTGSWPGDPRRVVQGYDMPEAMYARYVEESGAEAHRRVRLLVDGLGYQLLNDEDKADKIREAFQNARKFTRDRLGITLEAKYNALEQRAITGLGEMR